ncbi:hypothetical protein ACJ41O_014710 [Fusarium nematophilum]
MPDSPSQRYRRILPDPSRGGAPGSPSPPTITVPKRSAVKTACESCRQRKAKCDRRRPKCSPCLAAGKDCVFAAFPYELQAAALKRKHDELQSRVADHEDLYDSIRTGQLEEAEEIVRRIRTGIDVRSVTEDIHQGALLLQLASPSGEHHHLPGGSQGRPWDYSRGSRAGGSGSVGPSTDAPARGQGHGSGHPSRAGPESTPESPPQQEDTEHDCLDHVF